LKLTGNQRKTLGDEALNGYDDVESIKVALKIGNVYIEARGQDIDIPYYISIDSNVIKRKGEVLMSSKESKTTMIRVRRSGCIFIFERIRENSLYLREIKVKVKILPDNYQGKTMPVNFYAELAKTPNSIKILKESKQIEEFKKQLINEDTHLMTKRALLWTFGMIGSSDYGVELLEEKEVLEEIVNIAENSGYLSVRGNALFALSMICR